MNKEWSELNQKIQDQIKKRETFKDGIAALFQLRIELLHEILSFREALEDKAFSAIPFINAKGYHSKTIAYSLWHISRIEDIVVHSLILHDEEILFAGDYLKKINSPIITTGNELVKEQIADFSKQLDVEHLYKYINEVCESTNRFLSDLKYEELKRKMTDRDKEYLISLNVVSEDENASWLIDYWCGKDIKGLIQMPLSRHWIMHVEACLRIKAKLCK